MSNRFAVVTHQRSGTIEFYDLGTHARVQHEGKSQNVSGSAAGSSVWTLMKEAGLNPQNVNTFIVHQDSPDGRAVAYLHAVLEGARVVWLILYRADRDASAFKAAGSRQRIGDALDACFKLIIDDIQLPHKP